MMGQRGPAMDGRRVQGMWKRYQRGDVLALIGLYYGISAQAVHQTLKRAGYVTNRPRGRRPQTPSGHRVTLCKPACKIREPSALVWKPNANHTKPKAEPKAWCVQCDRNVYLTEAEQCSSQWCKAKV